MRNKYLGSVLLSILFITSLTASLSIAILIGTSPPVSAAGDNFIKVCVPDLGQHSKNWCWAAAAANSMYWYSQHGYLQLIDDPRNPIVNDNTYITTLLPHPPPPVPPDNGVYRLLQEIAIDSLFLGLPENAENVLTIANTWDNGILDNQYFFGLQEFINEQGASLTVHEIVDPALANIPPQNDNIVIYRLPTLRDYQNELALDNSQVLLWLSYRHTDNSLQIEETDHVVTGVGFGYDNTWITVSDPWTTGRPDHGNDLNHAPANHPYDNLTVTSAIDAPLTVNYFGAPAPGVSVRALIYILPTVPSAPVDNFKRENMPDLGQHCENWCWTAAASNIFKWYYHNGYPKVVDDPKDNVLDENYLQLLPAPPADHLHDNLLRLLHEIAKDCLYPNVAEENENTILLINTFGYPIDDNKYFYGLQKFIREQGGQFKVREIINNSHFGGLAENIPPENDNVVIYDQPTFDNYKNWLKLGGVLLQENFRNYSYEVSGVEALDHIITGVSYFDGGSGNQWIQVSDSWTPLPGPDHNDNENLYTYENLQVISDDPLTVMYTGYTPGGPMTVPVQIVNLVSISPENAGAGASVNLVAGWNLVGFTAIGAADTPSSIFAPLVYNTDYIMYSWTAPGGPYGLVDPTKVLKDNTGYWVWINTSKTVTTTGTRPASENIHLVIGWNLVGFPVVDGTTTPNKIFAPLIYNTDYIMYFWTAPGGPYGLVNPLVALKDNTGYWVDMITAAKTVTVP